MANSPLTLEGVIKTYRPLIEAGAALHWLAPRNKMPVADNWAALPTATVADLQASHRANANIGIRLGEPSHTAAGYLHIIDLDVRKPEAAHEARRVLGELLQNYNSLPTVVSGSGGESRHFYFFCDKPFAKKKLAKSDTYEMVFDQRLNREVKKNDWEIDLIGTGAQAVIPPSIHPDTGLPYKWLVELDFGLIELGLGPSVDAATVEAWGARVKAQTETFDVDDDDLIHDLRTAPLELTDEEIDKTVADLPEDWVEDRDTWVTVGAALHHQYQGGQKGFDRWCEWSKKSQKYDEKTQKTVWKSFKGDHRPVTMRTLIATANEKRLQDNLPSVAVDAEIDDTDDLDALLGPSKSAEIAPKSAEIAPYDEKWTSYLDRNEDGHPKGVLHNVKLILQNDVRLRGVLALNEFTQEIVLVNEPKRVSKKRDSAKPAVNLDLAIWKVADPVNGTLWTDSHDYSVRAVLEAPSGQGGYGFKVADRDLKAGVDSVANMQRFHPVRNYLEMCEAAHDGVFGRVDQLFVKYLGADDTPYHREAARLFLLGAVTRVFEPGHKFDFVPILEGAQGKRKSTFIATLGNGKWASELSGDFHKNAEMVEQIMGSWIVEIPELQGFSRADTNVLKAWISRTADKARLAYDRRARVFPRQCVFVGSTNDDDYLRDHTGGRRFWPIKCGIEGNIDTDALLAEVDMIWAEAVMIYREMRRNCNLPNLPLFLQSEEAQQEAETLQESRRVETVEDALSGTIQAWLDEPMGEAEGADELDPMAPQKRRNFTCAAQIWCEMMGNDIGRLGVAEATRIGRALGRLDGWAKVSSHVSRTQKYGRQRVFARVGMESTISLGGL